MSSLINENILQHLTLEWFVTALMRDAGLEEAQL